MTLHEIAALGSLVEVEQLANARGIPYEIQTNETMKVRLIPEYHQSKGFVADGRLLLTFWLHDNDDIVTAHVSFFYDSYGRILGRAILMENNNIP